MAAVRARCQRCRKLRTLEVVTAYVQPSTIRQVRVCSTCRPLVEKPEWFERKMVQK